MQDKNYPGVDFFRIPAAFLVVAIHIAPFSNWIPVLDVLFTYTIGRIAVPFFLMTTGFFVLAPYVRSKGRKRKRFLFYLRHNLFLYLAATVFYLPVNWYAGNLPHNGLSILKDLFFDGTFYHLWYFPAAILGCLLVVWLAKISMRVACIYSIIAYLIGLAGDSYYGLVQSVPFLKAFYDVLFSFSSYTRNGIFFAPIFLFLGMVLANPRNRCSKAACKWGLVCSIPLLLLEGYLTDLLHLQKHNSMYLFLLSTMYFLFQSLLRIRGQAPHWFREGSTLLYLIHPAVIVIVRGLAKITGVTKIFIDNPLVLYGTVCLLSAALIAAFLFYKERRKNLWIQREEHGSS